MPRTKTSRRSLTAALGALLGLGILALAGCGDDEGAAASPNGDTAGAQDPDAAHPVTIEHASGSTTVDDPPERIVTMSVQWTDAALAMGIEPVGYVLDQASGESDPYPWNAELLEGAERIDTAGAVPHEQIAALRPDLILTSYLGAEPEDFEKLEAIAPTIGLLGDLQVDPWQDQVDVMGRLLDAPDRAAEVVAAVENEVSSLATELPGLEGKSFVAANYVEGDGIYVIADPEDGASRLFYGLGMQIAPEIVALDEQAVGRVQISTEQVELLDADFLGILTNGSGTESLPGWDQLSAVQTGAVVDFAFADIVGLNTPTPLSLPHVIDLIRPALEAAAA